MYLTANGNPCDARPASRVVYNRFPRWFEKRIRLAYDPLDQDSDELNMLFRLARSICNRTAWFDHVGSTYDREEEVFVSEPYLRGSDDLTCARHIADLLDCNLEVSDQSYWFPGKTLRLIFRPKKTAGCVCSANSARHCSPPQIC